LERGAVKVTVMPTTNFPREPLTIGQWVRRILISGAVLLVLLFAVARWNLRQQVNAEIDRIRAAGQPVTLVELDEQFPDLGGRPDGSADLQRAFNSLVEALKRLETNGIPGTAITHEELPLIGKGSGWPLSQEELSPELHEALGLALAQVGPALDDLRAVVAREDHAFRFPIALTNGANTLLPHLAQMKRITQWQMLRSAWELDRGEANPAVQSIADSLRLTRAFEAEPTLISQLVRLAMLRIGVNGTERLVGKHPLTPEQAEWLRRELGKARPDKAMYTGMTGERCTGLDAMQPGSTSLFGPESQYQSDTMEGFLARATFLTYRMAGLVDRDTRFYLQTMSRVIATSTNSVRERVALANDGKAFDPSAHGKLYLFSSLLLPALEKAFVKEADCLTAIAAADAALAVEAWRAANAGRIPDSLADLVPEFFPEAPVDPATEKPLSIVPAATGYAIHGSGPLFTVRR
jgi:hypothetical protein